MVNLSSRAIASPKLYVWLPVIIAMSLVGIVALATLTDVLPKFISPLSIDTDPESMLIYDDPVRVINRSQKRKFVIDDLMVIGIANYSHENGAFNPQTLANVYDLANYAKTLSWKNEQNQDVGVVSVELISPSNVDNMEQGGLGSVNFNWLMPNPPETDEDAELVLKKARSQPILNQSINSKNGKILAIYIPMTSKDVSYKISNLLQERISNYQGADEYFITGLATAQDVFGVEMFQQMAIATPMAMSLIMFLLWYFFRNLSLIWAPMIVANLSVMLAMGSMIVSGHSIHIMTSMLPIFIMPIAVLDGVHILSEFHDSYHKFQDKKQTLIHIMKDLSKPMLLTTITTAIGFGALNLIPLPPLQDFGTFVSIGVIIAWLLTVTLIPAYIMLLPETKFSNLVNEDKVTTNKAKGLAKYLPKLGFFSTKNSLSISVIAVFLVSVSILGILKLVPNDNPMKWFSKSHDMRVADRLLNENFAGSYMAYLSFKGKSEQTFKQPEVLKYLNDLQQYTNDLDKVGKTIGLTEIVKTVHRELYAGDENQYRIPDSSAAIAETIITFQNSHRPNDLWHYVTPDFKEANIWLQLKSGDNQDMIKIEEKVEQYMKLNPAPVELTHQWFGMTHINVVWQELVTVGVVKAFSGSFLIILVCLTALFRSVLWGVLAMIPLTFTIALIYGFAGALSGNLDTPLAILSAVSIGLAVDYSIHFAVRSRELRKRYESWKDTLPAIFAEPSRAISRNVIVVGIGFLPLLATPLIPYQMVGVLLSSILFLAGFATLVIMPAVINLFKKQLFGV